MMTDDLVERMVAHRTRLAQEPMEQWHEDEDHLLDNYLKLSHRLDDSSQRLKVLVPRGWLLLAILALGPSFVFGSPTTARLGIAVGGVLLAYNALRHLVEGMEQFIAAWIACRRVSVFWNAQVTKPATPTFMPPGASDAEDGQPLVDAQRLVYRYPHRSEPVLQGVDLRVRSGDQILLEGDSGSGKTTLANILADLRTPQSGVLLLDGLDRHTIGPAGWRRRVVLAPQFHDNHVLLGSLAFNLLMGRNWPPTPQDLEAAWQVCQRLGMGPLLERMPGGMFQLVGETGWQLSHGEQSRLFMARALLQGTELVILDESLAALDPKTLQKTADLLFESARSVLLVAHP